jgi:NADH-ubiquinone oxidoreductase chain 6
MNKINILYETFSNGYRDEVLDILSLASIFCGILVIISKNPIVSVLFLIGLFFSISCYFIGLSYLLVYVGAVSILFLFILMLINVRISELLSNTSNSIPLAILITIAFNYPVYQVLPYSVAAFNSYTISLNNTINDLINNNYSDYLNKMFNFISPATYSQELSNGEISFVTSKV